MSRSTNDSVECPAPLCKSHPGCFVLEVRTEGPPELGEGHPTSLIHHHPGFATVLGLKGSVGESKIPGDVSLVVFNPVETLSRFIAPGKTGDVPNE